MRNVLWAVSVIGAGATLGCLSERTLDVQSGPVLGIQVPDEEVMTSTEVLPPVVARPIAGAERGFVAGTVGPIHDLDHEATRMNTYDDGYFLAVEAAVALEGRAAMVLLNINNGSHLLTPGTVLSVPFDWVGPNGESVMSVGCAGPAIDNYEYDAPADETTIVVESGEDENELDVQIQSRFYVRDKQGVPQSDYTEASTSFVLTR